MNIQDLGVISIPAITLICYLIGIVCKTSEHIKDEWIPAIMGVAGAVFGIVAFVTKMPEIGDVHIITAIAIGIASGAAATWVNQIFKQAEKGKMLLEGDEEDI